MKNKILIITFIMLTIHAQSQIDACVGSLSGSIIDEHDHSPLDLATVYIVELQRGSLSDSSGNYRIENICEGIYTVQISHVGCEQIEMRISIKGETVYNFYPEHHLELLKGVEVSETRAEVQTTQNKSSVSDDDLSQSKGQTLGSALTSISGVNTLNSGSSIAKPIIHGMHSNRILILNNGIRQEGQQWGIEHAPEVDPFIANSISVIKGANSVRYGSDAIAGVVLVDTKPLRDSAGISGELNLVGMSNGRGGTASAYVEGNVRKLSALSWRLQGTLKQHGSITAPEYLLVNTGLKENNFSYALGWKKKNYNIELFYSQFNTDLGILAASHIGNLTDLKRAFEREVPLQTGEFTYQIARPSQHIEHELFKAKSSIKTGSWGNLYFTYARQYNLRYEFDKHRPLSDSLEALNKPDLQFELTSHTADVVLEHTARRRFSGSAGISGMIQGNTYEGRALIPNFRSYNGGVFVIERWKMQKLELEGGLRYDYRFMQIYKYEYVTNGTYALVSPVHIFQNTSGSIGAIYKIDSTLNVSLNLGSAWRAPSANELYSFGLHHGAAALEYGDDKLGTEVAYNAILTLRHQRSNKLFMEVSPYVNFIRGFIYREPAAAPILTIHGAFPAFYFKQTDATISGCDFLLNYKPVESIELSSKASMVRARNLNDQNWLIMMPSDRINGTVKYRFKGTKSVYDGYVSSVFQYVAKQWRVPANSDFVAPPDAYFLIDLHGSFTMKIQNQPVEIGMSVFNLLNTSYRDYLDRFRYFSDAMGRNISLRIKVPFNTNFKQKQ